MNFSTDYILRLIQQLQRAIARMRKHTEEERFDDAMDEVGDTCDDLLGHQAHMLDTLDCPSVARILGKWFKIKIYVELLRAEADIREARRSPDDLRQAPRLRQRALQLLLLGDGLGGRGDPVLLDTARELLTQVDAATLAPRYQRLLNELNLTP